VTPTSQPRPAGGRTRGQVRRSEDAQDAGRYDYSSISIRLLMESEDDVLIVSYV